MAVEPVKFEAIDENGLLHFYNVEEYYRYPYILSSYRPPRMTRWQCIKSLLFAHNQQLNAIIMIILLPAAITYTFVGLYAVPTPLQTHIAILLLIQWFIEAPFSIIYHTFQSVDITTAKRLCRLDYASQLVACPIGLYVNMYYAWNEEATLRVVLFTVACTVSVIFLLITVSEHWDAFSMKRTLIISGPAVHVVLNLAPIFYSEMMDGFTQCGIPAIFITVNWIICCIVWLNHIPERWYPLTFDKYTHSHTIMHMHVVIFQALQFYYLVSAADEYTDTLKNKF